MTADVSTLQTIINHAHRLVFFGGAGVSTESGIPDFRSQDHQPERLGGKREGNPYS